MQQRLLLFFLVAVALLIGNAFLGVLFPRPEVARPEPEAVEQVDPAARPDPARPEPRPEPEDEPDRPPAIELPPVAAQDELPERWVTLGSIEPGPANPYRMLVTLTSKGAAVERLELSNDRFRDLQDRTGYLGHLAPVEFQHGDGVLVRVVGDGTPAAKAGMEPGDVITRLDEHPVARPEDLRRLLSLTRPGRNIELQVLRDGQPMTLAARLERRPLEVMRPETENLRARNEENVDQYLLPAKDAEGRSQERDPASFLLTLEQVGQRTLDAKATELAGLDLRDGHWELASQSQSAVEFRRVLPEDGLEVIKRYALVEVPVEQLDNVFYKGYHLELDVVVRNVGQQEQRVAYRLDGATGLPIEGWWYSSKISRDWGGVGVRDVVGWWEGQKPVMFSASSIAQGKIDAKKDHSLMYLGVDALYFSSVIIPKKEDLKEVWLAESMPVRLTPEPTRDTNPMLTNITTRMISKPARLAPGDELQHSYQVFTGPKKPALLAKYGQEVPRTNGPGVDIEYSLQELVYYGWFGWVAKSMLAVLHFFYGIVGNYGLAIIMLTVLVRAAMFPLSRKQALNMVKMQELQPEIKKIHERYKKDLEKRTKAQQDLFRKHNYNPMGGCLLMFLQLPIFIGLYRSLMVDVELRQAPLISDAIRWCSNLSAPDMLFDWTGFMPEFLTKGTGLFVLGPYFNILPVVTVALFLMQQKMFMPPATDEQTAMQQKIMKYMMVFIGILFYKVAAGLCIYFIASTTWGIAERKLLPKFSHPAGGDSEGAKKGGAAAPAAAASAGGRAAGTSPAASADRVSSNGGPRRKKNRQKRK